jgi:hypothetical protein
MLLAAVAVAVLLVHLGRTGIDRASAQTAADAAALAGVVEGRPGAEQLADENGAVLVSFEVHQGEVQVTVEVGSVRATARAGLEVPR